MRRKLLSALVFAWLSGAVFAGWQFDHLLIDFHLPQSNSYGIHAVAVDPAGRIWVGLHGIRMDTIYTATDTIAVNSIYVLNPDGTHASFSPIKFLTINGVTDTLTGKCKGMSVDRNGNILYTMDYTLYRINYQTGEGMNKVELPIQSSATEAVQDDNGYIYIGHVLGGDKPVYIYDDNFNFVANAIDTLGYINRTLLITPDGHDLYTGSTWNGFGIVHYHSDLPGVIQFTAVDTFGNWYNVPVDLDGDGTTDTVYAEVKLWASCLDWGPNGNIWAGDLRPDWSGPKGGMYYAYDPQTHLVVDSVGIAMGDSSAGGIYSPRGAAWSADGNTMYLADYDYNVVSVWTRTATSVDGEQASHPQSFTLLQNYPNPFNPVTVIPFELKHAAHVVLNVFDTRGRLVKKLVDKNLPAGHHTVRFDASNLASGVYVYQLKADGQTLGKNMLLVK